MDQQNDSPDAPVDAVVRRQRSYYMPVSAAYGNGPICETREEARKWLESPDGIHGSKIIVQRMSPTEYASLPEFEGW